MPNIGQLLKSEIIRLSRREQKKLTLTLQKASAAYRRDIASLKRQVAALEREAKRLNRVQPKSLVASEARDETSLRFRADGFKTLRKKLGLSAEQTAKLLGVSGQSVYAWETKRSTPRRSQLPAIAALRQMGKREAYARLHSLDG
jgi:DNA-binding transcriptional regulator YiaG